MKPATIRLPEPMKADLKAEAEERGLTFSTYVREQLKQRDPDADLSDPEADRDTPADADHGTVGDLVARVERLEAEVGIGDNVPDAGDTADQKQEQSAGEAGGSQVPLLDALLGVDKVLPEHHAVEGCLYLLIASGTTTADSLKSEVYADYPTEYDDANTWYTELIKPYLRRIAETGAISEDGEQWRVDPDVTLTDPTPPTATA